MTPADYLVLAASAALLAGFHAWLWAPRRDAPTLATAGAGGVQEATIVVKGGYTPDHLTVRAGTPVRLTFERQEDSACTDRVVMPAFGINRELPGFAATSVEFTPSTPGVFEFACGMNMVHGKVTVVAPDAPKGTNHDA